MKNIALCLLSFLAVAIMVSCGSKGAPEPAPKPDTGNNGDNPGDGKDSVTNGKGSLHPLQQGTENSYSLANAVISLPTVMNPMVWGYDLKQPQAADKTYTSALANSLFNEDGMTFIRVPIFCNYFNQSDCSLQEANSFWVNVKTAIQTTMAVKPDVKIFASLKLEGIYGISVDGYDGGPNLGTFPTWAYNSAPDLTKNYTQGSVKADVYTAMLANYLLYMKRNGFPVDYLAIDNEPEHSCTGFDRLFDLYISVLDGLKAKAATMGFDMPKQFVAPEPIGPKQQHIDFVNYVLTTKNRGDLMTVLGLHYYPTLRYNAPVLQSRLKQIVAATKGCPLWMTEAHYDPLDQITTGSLSNVPGIGAWTELDRANLFMVTNFDLFDSGCSGYFMWAYKRDDTNTKGSVCRELAHSTVGYTPAPIDINLNPDGSSKNAVDRGFNIRSLVNGKAVSVWITNIRDAGATTDITKKDYVIAVRRNTVQKVDSYLVWNDACWAKSPYSAATGPTPAISDDGKYITFTIPDRCMALLKFEMN